MPLSERKFLSNLRPRFSRERVEEIYALLLDRERLQSTLVSQFMGMMIVCSAGPSISAGT